MIVALTTLIGAVIFGGVVWLCLRRICPQPSQAEVLEKRFGPGKPPVNERFMERFRPHPPKSRAAVCWVAEGKQHSLEAKVVDLSDDGARIKSSMPLEPDMSVVLEMPHYRLAGTARVRYCQKRTLAYSVGLSFKGGLFRIP